MSLGRELRQGAGRFNRRLQQAVLETEWVPGVLARAFGAAHGRLMTAAYALPIRSMRVEPRHWLARLLRPGDVMLDVGASHGLTATIASRRVGPRGHVHAFEPQVRVHAELERKRRRFGWSNVSSLRTLVGPKSGEAVLFEHPYESEISSLSAGWNRGVGTESRHAMLSLDDWAERTGPERVDLIKIDVEGAELGVIQGARRLLSRHRPALLIEINNRPRRPELFGYTIDDLLAELRELGYEQFFSLRPEGLHAFERESELELPDRDMLAR
jgi:FkbM family methyltransferase